MQSLNRRRFLNRLGAGIAATAVASNVAWARQPARSVNLRSGSEPDWQAIKASFGLDPNAIHLGGFYLASHPAPVRAAIERHRTGLDLDPLSYTQANEYVCEDRALVAAAEYLGVKPEQIALTDSTTMGLGLIYSGIDIAPGQEIVSTTHDHWATQRPLTFRKRRFGTPLRQVALYDRINPGALSEEQLLAPLFAAVNSNTRLIAVTWVHSTSGVKLPVRRIAERVAKLNSGRSSDSRILLCVDGVHAFGVEDFTFDDLGCDFFVAGCHKWLFGPRGTGLVCGKSEAWKAVTPTFASFSTYAEDGPAGKQNTPGGFHSFEHRWALPEAFAFHLEIGKANVTHRIRELVAAFKRGLSAIEGVKMLTPLDPGLSAGIISFDLPKYTQAELLAKFKASGVHVAFNYAGVPGVRVAPGLINDPAEIERTLEVLRAIA